MQKFLTAGWRRYALAFVVVSASLGVVAACSPTKQEPPPPPPPPTLLTIAPSSWTYTAQGEKKVFTVTNLGPNQSSALHTGIFGGNAGPSEFVISQDNCVRRTPVQGDNCTIEVQHFGDVGAHHDTFLNVSSDNTQQGGVQSHLVGH
jgi:hypothetical protein